MIHAFNFSSTSSVCCDTSILRDTLVYFSTITMSTLNDAVVAFLELKLVPLLSFKNESLLTLIWKDFSFTQTTVCYNVTSA